MPSLSHDDVLYYAIKHGQTNLLGSLSYSFESKLQPNLNLILAIVYNQPAVLDKLLKLHYAETPTKKDTTIQEAHLLCRILKRPNCKAIFHKYKCGTAAEGEKLDGPKLTKLLLNLLKHYSDFKEEITGALRKIPNIKEACETYLRSKNRDYNPHIVKVLLDLEVFSDNNGIIEENLKNEIITSIIRFMWMKNTDLRQIAKIVVEANIDLCIPALFLRRFATINRIRSQAHDGFYQRYCKELYQTDVKEHGCFGYEKENFPLNFTVPFLLECGISFQWGVNWYLQDSNLHSAEHEYLQYYIKYSSEPQPLMAICRIALRKHFKGRYIHKFVEASNCPEKIKNFILMKHLLH